MVQRAERDLDRPAPVNDPRSVLSLPPQEFLPVGIRDLRVALRQVAGDRLWADGCHPVLIRAGRSLDQAGLTGPAVDHWNDLAATSNQLLGAGHPAAKGETVRATDMRREALKIPPRAFSPHFHDVIVYSLRLAGFNGPVEELAIFGAGIPSESTRSDARVT